MLKLFQNKTDRFVYNYDNGDAKSIMGYQLDDSSNPTDGQSVIFNSSNGKWEYITVNNLTYKGTFGSAESTTGGDLPSSGVAANDYYICNTSDYVSVEAGITFQNGDWAIYNGTSWQKVDNQDNKAVWGKITGTLTDQTDLTTYLTNNYAGLASANTFTSTGTTSFAGNIGIGTTTVDTGLTAGKVLQVSSTLGSELILDMPGNTIANKFIGGLAFRNIDSTTANPPHLSGIQARAYDATGNMILAFYTGVANYKANTPQMVLDHTGSLNVSNSISIGGTSINTAGTLSNVAYLDAANTFTSTGTNSFAGNVGIGIATATAPLSIYSATDGKIEIKGTSTSDAKLDLIEVSSASQVFGGSGSGFRLLYDGGDNYLYLISGAGATVNTRLAVDRDTGFFGFGVTDPDEQIEMTGRLHLGQTTAPGTTTDKLYNVGGTLYWNGSTLGGLTNFTETGSTSALSKLVTSSGDANVSVLLAGTKGTGYLIIGDSSGNTPGNYAVDIQNYRASAASAATGANSTAIGYNCTASTSNSLALGSGQTASGTNSYAIGYSNTSSGTGSLTLGTSNSSTTSYGTAIGYYASAIQQGQIAYSGGSIQSTAGTEQGSNYILRQRTTDATPTELTTNNASASSGRVVELKDYQTIAFHGIIVANRKGSQATDESAAWKIEGVIRRGANAASTVLVNSSVTSLGADTNASSWTIGLTANTTIGSLAITATGEASESIQWVGNIMTVESKYA